MYLILLLWMSGRSEFHVGLVYTVKFQASQGHTLRLCLKQTPYDFTVVHKLVQLLSVYH